MEKYTFEQVAEGKCTPFQVMAAFAQRFPDSTEAHMREFAEVVGVSYKVVDEFIGGKESYKGVRD